MHHGSLFTYLDRNGTALRRFKMNHASVLEAGRSETIGILDPPAPVSEDLWLVFFDPCVTLLRFEKLVFKLLPTDSGFMPSSGTAAYSLLALLHGELIISFSSKLSE